MEFHPPPDTPVPDPLNLALRRLLPEPYAERLLASKGRLEGERRIVTILFSDVKGSTAMGENLDPEEVLEIMNGAFEELIAPITRYEGTLARLMGDSILAFFGAPTTHEDDPVRACRAALEIVEGVGRYAKRLERERGIRGFNVRVGINTGLVVVAEVGADLRVEYTAMGDAVNLAARMESAAEPGTVLITDATCRLIDRDFETLALEPILVKGKSKPVKAFQLLRPRAALESHGARHPKELHLPLVGREAELRNLRKALREVKKGRGARWAITGEAGVGKSRLASEARPKSPGGLRWVELRGLEYTQGVSYWIARNLLCNLTGVEPDASPAELGRALRSVIDRLCPSQADEIHPYLSLLFNLPLPASLKSFLDGMRPELLRQKGFQGFRELIRQLSLEQPLVIVWDDLQYLDRPSLDLLESLMTLTDVCPLVLMLIFRPGTAQIQAFYSRTRQAYGEKFQTIELHPLMRQDSVSLLENILRGRRLPESTRNQILDKTEGNPLFLEEVVCSLPDSGGEIHVPDTLNGIIMSRIDRLGLEDRKALQTASVLGRTFQKRALAHVMNTPGVDQFLEELQHREFIRTPDSGSSAGIHSVGEYMFKQSLTQDVAYNTLLVSQRKSLHKRAGEALELLFPTLLDDLAAALALHFEKAELKDKALTYLIKAGHRAKQGFANGEAIDCFTRALKLAEETGLDPYSVAEIHEALGDVYALVAKYTPAFEQYESAARGRMSARSRAVLQRKMGQVNENRGLYAQAIECYQAALTGLGGEVDPIESGRVRIGLGLVYYRLGRLEEAVEASMQALEIMQERGNARGIAEACNNLGIIHCRGGEIEKALGYHQRCLSLWTELGDMCGLAASHNNLGQLYHQQENWVKAIDHYLSSLELCEKTGNRHGLARTYDNIGQAYASQGQIDQACAFAGKAARLLAEIDAESSDIVPEMWQQSGVW